MELQIKESIEQWRKATCAAGWISLKLLLIPFVLFVALVCVSCKMAYANKTERDNDEVESMSLKMDSEIDCCLDLECIGRKIATTYDINVIPLMWLVTLLLGLWTLVQMWTSILLLRITAKHSSFQEQEQLLTSWRQIQIYFMTLEALTVVLVLGSLAMTPPKDADDIIFLEAFGLHLFIAYVRMIVFSTVAQYWYEMKKFRRCYEERRLETCDKYTV